MRISKLGKHAPNVLFIIHGHIDTIGAGSLGLVQEDTQPSQHQAASAFKPIRFSQAHQLIVELRGDCYIYSLALMHGVF